MSRLETVFLARMENTILSTPSQSKRPNKKGCFYVFKPTVQPPPLRCPPTILPFSTGSKFLSWHGALAKGDVLVGADEMKPLEIIKIEEVSAVWGIFAPLTTDGTIATNYKIVTCSWFAHMRYSPLRLASIGIPPWFAKATNNDGRNFLSCAYLMSAEWMHAHTPNALSYGLVALGTVLFYSLCGIALLSYGIECRVGPALGPTAIVLIVGAAMDALTKQRPMKKVNEMKVKVH